MRLNKFGLLISIILAVASSPAVISAQTADQSSLTLDTTADRHSGYVTDETFRPNEKHSKYKIYGMGGGYISARGRLMLGQNNKYADTNEDGTVTLSPADGYSAAVEAKLWASLIFKEESMLKAGANVIFRYDNGNLLPVFNIDELFFKWRYPMGDIIIGRNVCSTYDPILFGGQLDGIQVNLNVPFLNFRSFIGYSGWLGLFNPYFNPYEISQYDRTYKETTNLALIHPEYNFVWNAEQAKRLFFCTDFDIYLAGIHIDPYFLMQIDLSEIVQGEHANNINTLNTFHLGLNNEGRIIDTLYYKINLMGMFGFSKDIPTGDIYPMISCALVTQLRYTFVKAAHSTLMLTYAFGTGNESNEDGNNDFWNDNYHYQSAKFYYYGRFDGGFVLNPILSNIHSLSFKYQVTPVDRDRVKLCLYTGIYQTFKFHSDGDISFDGFDSDNAVVGTEFDIGLNINAMPVFTFGIDFGLLIPENGVQTMPIFRSGINFVWTL